MPDNFLLIGVDGGATKINACVINRDQNNLFSRGNLSAEIAYSEIHGYLSNFSPIDIRTQLVERENHSVNLTLEEEQQGSVIIEACAQAIEFIAKKSGHQNIIAGIGFPGLKTGDKRGIEAMANGPRMVHLSDLLEKRLQMKSINFVTPVNQLGSDADYCGIGENFSQNGLFRDVSTAYYLGGGTGAADALKIEGELIPFDRIKDWMAKSWEMKNSKNVSLEQYTSAGGIQKIYAVNMGVDPAEITGNNIFPDEIARRAVNGDSAAQDTFSQVSQNLAMLLFERITTLYAGWLSKFTFLNPDRQIPKKNHPCRGKYFDRIVIGQRLGELWNSPAGDKLIRMPVEDALDDLIQMEPALDLSAKKYYKSPGRLIKISELRDAPAIGAGIDAFMNWKNQNKD
ncbi:MAG: hypothetical protein AB7T22_07885 [Calditrichaceae bacterium]